jgi:DNA-binding NtrC family response regulator
MAKETILIIEDEEYLAQSIRDLLEPTGYVIHIASDREEGREKIDGIQPDLLLLDLALPPSYAVRDGIEFFKECLSSKPSSKIVVMTGQGKVDDAIECIRYGAEDFLLKPVNPDVLAIVVERALYKHLLEKKVNELEANASESFDLEGLVGTSKAMRKVFKGILYAASIDENVLVTGETGAGKGVVAKAIHQRSDRRESPFVHVNCAALSRTIIESELFGHEKGAFTGAKDFKLGKFEYAADGSVFLDEVAEIPVDLQIKLLHAVEEKTIQRVGGNTDIQLQARIIAAANRDLSEAVAEGSFRKDLFYRLNILPIRIPPLRERKEDIPILVSYFLEKYCRKHGKPPVALLPSALARLEEHDWPGNVRELENVLARAVISTKEKTLSSDDFTLSLRALAEDSARMDLPGDDGEEDLVDAVEEQLASEYRTALLKAKGNKSMAAKLLGLPESTFRYRLKKYRRFLR